MKRCSICHQQRTPDLFQINQRGERRRLRICVLCMQRARKKRAQAA